ncbi:hypothetical protein L4C34_03225 [Vibrio profundum]|uniref:outer membrane protein OmpK n=1 Tax=Vibrio profundum TaxID=2910247 RepID=UPI003D12DBC0
MLKRNLFAAVYLSLFFSTQAYSEYLYGWANTSINYLDWSSGTQVRAPFQDNYLYPQVEGGASFDWGELYGFYEIQKINRSSETWATAYKPKLYYKLGLGELRFYAQHYAKDAPDFALSNTVGGLTYRFSGEGWFLYPWAGPLFSNLNRFGSSYTGFNGYVAGLTGVYKFSAYEQNFQMTMWHETEFLRKHEFLTVANEEDKGTMNGALGIWWLATKKVSFGVQYRYAYNKFATSGNQNAMIYSVKYKF